MIRILYVAWGSPYPTNTGGRQRSNLLHRALSDLGEVDMLCLGDPSEYTAKEIESLRRDYGMIGMQPMSSAGDLSCLKWLRGFAPKLVDRVSHNLLPHRSFYIEDKSLIERVDSTLNWDKYDVVVGRYARSLAKLGAENKGVPVLLDIDDLDSDAYDSRASQLGQSKLKQWILASHARKVKKSQDNYLAKIQGLWVANPANISHPGLEKAIVLPNIPFSPIGELSVNPEPVIEGNKTVMTIASYGHTPNVIGVDWFLENVWQKVVDEVPSAEFHIYGSQMSETLRERWGNNRGVQAIGFVDHVADAYRECAISVCTVLSGAGTNIKVLESGLHRRVCVVTEAASRGFSEGSGIGSSLPVAKTAEEMANILITYLNCHAKNTEHANLFRDAVLDNFSYMAFAEAVKQLVSRVKSDIDVYGC